VKGGGAVERARGGAGGDVADRAAAAVAVAAAAAVENERRPGSGLNSAVGAANGAVPFWQHFAALRRPGAGEHQGLLLLLSASPLLAAVRQGCSEGHRYIMFARVCCAL
jgi:hypothetical protein